MSMRTGTMAAVAALLLAGCVSGQRNHAGDRRLGYAVEKFGGYRSDLVPVAHEGYTRMFSEWEAGVPIIIGHPGQDFSLSGRIIGLPDSLVWDAVELRDYGDDTDGYYYVVGARSRTYDPFSVYGYDEDFSLYPGRHIFRLAAVNNARIDEHQAFMVTVTELDSHSNQ